MDLIIKNLESLKYFEGKPQPKTITIDIKKVIEDSVEFSETFEKSCEKYIDPKCCFTCKHLKDDYNEFCRSCDRVHYTNWEPTLEEATEHMKNEDVTGKEVKVFLDGQWVKERR